jgi:CRP-like cAMP-binding protein
LLAKKLQGFDTLSQEEVQVLERAASATRIFEPDADMVTFGDSPSFSTLLVDGWAARYKTLEGGTRQITAIHIPGDFVDLHSFLLRPMDHSVVALSACRVAMFPHDRLQKITENHPHLTRVLWLSTLIDAAMHREWLAAMGRLPVVSQLAHLICELYHRLDAVGLIKDCSFDFPVTQTVIADTLGVSLVHLNRSLQDIRARGLLIWQQKKVSILDWDGLKALAQFDATYLHQVRRPPTSSD